MVLKGAMRGDGEVGKHGWTISASSHMEFHNVLYLTVYNANLKPLGSLRKH